VRRGNAFTYAAIVGCATALGGGCALVVGFPDRTAGSTAGTGGASSSSSGSAAGGASASTGGSSGGSGGDGGHATSVASSGAGGCPAGSSSSGGPSTPCQALSPQPLFCDDFETCPLEPTFTLQLFKKGTAALSTAQAKPLPGHSFEAYYEGASPPFENLGQISKHFSKSYASMHLGFDVLIEQYAGGASLTYLAEIDLDDGHGALLYAVPTATTFQQKFPNNTLGNEIGSSAALPLHAWTPVDIALELGGTPTITLTIGGVKLIDAAPLAGAWTPGLPTIRLGTVVATLSDARDVFYDNVVFDAH
jgi:hypothetical protein